MEDSDQRNEVSECMNVVGRSWGRVVEKDLDTRFGLTTSSTDRCILLFFLHCKSGHRITNLFARPSIRKDVVFMIQDGRPGTYLSPLISITLSIMRVMNKRMVKASNRKEKGEIMSR